MSRPVVVIADNTSVALRLASGREDRRLLLSYGEEVPDLVEVTYWMAGAYAARLRRSGLAPGLTAPGWRWLAEIGHEWTGRTLHAGTIEDVPDGLVFAKPADAKVHALPARVWNGEAFRAAYAAAGTAPGTRLQWTTDTLRLDWEHRFFVLHGEVVTGSPYLVNGVVYHPGIASTRFDEARRYAEHVVRGLGDDFPPTCSLDVAWDTDAERWLVLEANPAWSSGPYGCDPISILRVLDHTQEGGRWTWEADPDLVARAEEAPLVRVVGDGEAYGFVEMA